MNYSQNNMAYRPRSQSYNFTPGQPKPHRLSRSKIDLFVECPRCFYLDQRLGIARPRTPPFTLNNAVDELLKKEFDTHREAQTPHPLMQEHGIDAVPLKHADMEKWRDALKRGIEFLHEPTNLSIRGGIDDVWINSKEELIIVDYKATAGKEEVTLDDEWKNAYKRQMEVYQWLFRQNGFAVSDTGYFVYANGSQKEAAFDAKLVFEMSVLPYTGNTDWIEPVIQDIYKTLTSDAIPPTGERCEYCPYRMHAGKTLLEMHRNAKG